VEIPPTQYLGGYRWWKRPAKPFDAMTGMTQKFSLQHLASSGHYRSANIVARLPYAPSIRQMRRPLIPGHHNVGEGKVKLRFVAGAGGTASRRFALAFANPGKIVSKCTASSVPSWG
jgi:hypothetical protein